MSVPWQQPSITAQPCGQHAISARRARNKELTCFLVICLGRVSAYQALDHGAGQGGLADTGRMNIHDRPPRVPA